MTAEALPLAGRTALVTGGTDGIGRATALALHEQGADVVAIGRSATKAAALRAEAEAKPGPGRLTVLVRDLSLMAEVVAVTEEAVARLGKVDLLLHAVGVLLTKAEYTSEGLEKDFAVSYLARYLILEEAARFGALHPGNRLVNIAASAPRVPRIARMEYSSLDQVSSRTGMRAHGQAQLACDLLTALAPARYGITAVGYGPGAVDTSIRREIPRLARAVLGPFYARATRTPQQAAADVVAALADPDVTPGSATFRNRTGGFPPDPYITDSTRQADLVAVSDALVRRALARRA